MRLCILACLAVLAAAPALGQDKKDRIDLKIVKYGELGKVIRQHQGKVILVDLWATW